MIDLFGRVPEALAAHERMPAGRTYIHLTDTHKPDVEKDEAARMRAYRSWRRAADAARALGVSIKEYRSQQRRAKEARR